MLRAYLRASTTDQDADRARSAIQEFVTAYGERVAAWYVENASGRDADRAELQRLLDDAHPGDVLLVESIDRLTRLPSHSWRTLRQEIEGRGVRVVSIDLPTTHRALAAEDQPDDLTNRIIEATNGMLLEVIAAQAASDYETRRRRQMQGIEKAKRQGKYRGRPIDRRLHERIKALLRDGNSIRRTADLAGTSPTTVQRVKNAEVGHVEPVTARDDACSDEVQLEMMGAQDGKR